MATFTVEVASKNAGDWTLDAGSDVVTAVQYGGSHDDDTSKIQSLNSIGSYQEYNVTMTGGPVTGDTITQVAVTARVKRALSSDANYSVSYSFTKSPSGTQSGTSATQTSTSSWVTYTYTDSGLSAVYGSGFKLKITAEQARYLECSTLYAVITYTPAPTNQTLTGAVISSTATLYAPSKINQKLTAPHISSTASVYAGGVVKKLTGATIASGAALYAPSKVSQQIVMATIASGAALYAPSSVTIAGATTTLTGAHIASGAALYAPSKVSHRLPAPRIASTAALYGPMAYRGKIHIDAVTTYAQGDVSSASFQHTTPAGNNRLLLVVATYYDTAGVASLTFGESGVGNGQVDYPQGLLVGGDSIYLVDTENHRVQKFDLDGNYISQFGEMGADNGRFMYPRGIAEDSAGNLYVTDTVNYRVQKFNSSGVYVSQWGTEGTDNGQFTFPWGIAIDSSDNVYVVDYYSNRIQKFDSSGTYVTKWNSTVSGGVPTGIAVDSNDRVLVCESYGIAVYDSSGNLLEQWGERGVNNGQFGDIIAITIDASDNVYVTDVQNYRVQKLDSTGAFLQKWGGYGTGDGQFRQPEGIAVDASGAVYVSDVLNNRIDKFDADLHLNAATYNGVEMEVGPGVDSGSYFQNFYTLPNPPVGEYPLALVSPTEPNAFIVTAISFSGVESYAADYTGADAGRAEQETSTTALQVAHNRTYPTNSLSLWALLYETAGTTLTAAAGNWTWFSQNVGNLRNTLGFRPTAARTTASQTFGATASPAVTQKISGVIHLESVRGTLEPPAWSPATTLYGANITIGQQLLPPAVASTAALHAPTLMKVVTLPTIAGGATARTPSKVSHKLGGAVITGGTRYAPTVAPGARTLAGATISSGARYAPTVVAGGVTLDGEYIEVTPTVYTPAAIVPGGVVLVGRPVDVGTVVHAPRRVDNVRLVAPPAIDSTAQVYAPASATVRLYIYAPHIGCETPMAINSPALVNLATVYAMTALHMRLYGATINGGTVHAPAAIASGPRVQTGDVFPPEEVGTV